MKPTVKDQTEAAKDIIQSLNKDIIDACNQLNIDPYKKFTDEETENIFKIVNSK